MIHRLMRKQKYHRDERIVIRVHRYQKKEVIPHSQFNVHCSSFHNCVFVTKCTITQLCYFLSENASHKLNGKVAKGILHAQKVYVNDYNDLLAVRSIKLPASAFEAKSLFQLLPIAKDLELLFAKSLNVATSS